MVKVASDIWRATGMAKPRPEWARFLLVCSLIYAGSMILRYVLAMIYRPEMCWFGGTIPIFFHFVLAGFLYTWGSSIHKAAYSTRNPQ